MRLKTNEPARRFKPCLKLTADADMNRRVLSDSGFRSLNAARARTLSHGKARRQTEKRTGSDADHESKEVWKESEETSSLITTLSRSCRGTNRGAWPPRLIRAR